MDSLPALDWRLADRRLGLAANAKRKLDHEIGCALLDALHSGAHVQLGFGSFTEYAERRFGFAPRWTRERLRVAMALEDLPKTSEALREGDITWAAARELTRVAEDHCEEEWLERARTCSQRDLEYLCARHVRGDRPTDPPRPDARQHVLRFELSGHAFALWRELEAALARELGEPLAPEEVLIVAARRVLGGPDDSGRASYQIAVTECPHCRETTQLGGGEPVRVDAADVEMAECDAQRVDATGRAAQDVPPATRRLVMLRDHGQCRVPGCRNGRWVGVHHLRLRSEGGDHDASNLIVLCEVHHRALHRGQLHVSGSPDEGLEFRHADGAPYGAAVDPEASGIATDAFLVLRRWGVGERAAKRAVSAVMTRTGRAADFDTTIRMALAELRLVRPRAMPRAGPA